MIFGGVIDNFFLLLNTILSYGWTTFIYLFTYWSISLLPGFAIINKIAINISVQILCSHIFSN